MSRQDLELRLRKAFDEGRTKVTHSLEGVTVPDVPTIRRPNMGVIRGVIRFFFGVMMAAMAAGAIAAIVAKRRIVRVMDEGAEEFRAVAIFEPLSFRSTSKALRGGSIDCWYGGGVIDLRDAVLDPTGATIRVRAIFGGGQIAVPETWRVTSHVRGLGGLGDSRPHIELPENAPHLIIEGLAIFGGFGVTASISEEEIRRLQQAVERRAGHETTPKLEVAA